MTRGKRWGGGGLSLQLGFQHGSGKTSHLSGLVSCLVGAGWGIIISLQSPVFQLKRTP